MGNVVDGSAGFLDGVDVVPSADRAWWARYRDRVEEAARQAGSP